MKDKKEEKQDQAKRAFKQRGRTNIWEKKEGGRCSVGYEKLQVIMQT